MISIIISSIAGFLSFVLLDYVWLAVLAKNFYLKNLLGHVTIKNEALTPYLPAVPVVYVVAIIGIWVFVISKSTTLLESFLYGTLLGFVLYAFYDFTNLATLKDYPLSLTLVDTLWGTILVGIVSAIIFFTKNLTA
jgi:uncharacterized membrane protein